MKAVSIFSVSMSSRIFVGSGSGITTFLQPKTIPIMMIIEPAMRTRGERTKLTDHSFQSLPQGSSTIGVEARIFLFVSLAPFGRPVVPEV